MRFLALSALLTLAACASPAEPALRQAEYYCDLGYRSACTHVSVLRSTVALDNAETAVAVLGVAAMGFGAYTATLPGHAVPLYPYPWYYGWW